MDVLMESCGVSCACEGGFMCSMRKYWNTVESSDEGYLSFIWVKTLLPALEKKIEEISTVRSGRAAAAGIVELFRKFIGKGYALKDILKMGFKYPEKLDYVLGCFSKERFPTYHLRSELLMDEIKCGNRRSLVMIKYGFKYSYNPSLFMTCFMNISNCIRVNGIEKINTDIDRDLLMELCYRHKCHLRMQLLMELLLITYNKQEEEMKKDVYRLLWKTVRYPFISKSEMYSLLEPLFFAATRKVMNLCDKFAERNDICDVPEVSQPRSLKHLARVQVRENLCKADQLSDDAIDSLAIPRMIKEYLKLNDEYLTHDLECLSIEGRTTNV